MAQVVMLDQEEWHPVVGWEGKYWVSSFGRVKGTRGMLKPQKVPRTGYLQVSLEKGRRKDGTRVAKYALVHRLVAQAFIPNPNGYPQVNHKDECRTNNNLDNLEWCTPKYNMHYNNGMERRRAKIDYYSKARIKHAHELGISASKAVAQLTTNGKLVKIYYSSREASRQTGIDGAHIREVVNNKTNRRTAGGYKWVAAKGGAL